MDSAQKLVLVTGSSSGIGRALVELLLRDDWHVVGVARRDPGIEHRRYTHRAADLSDLQSLGGLVDEAVGARLDGVERLGLVNNAALFGSLSWMRAVEATDLGRMYAVNSAAPQFLMGRFAKIRPAGSRLRIVNVSSGAAHSAYPGLGDYCATKAALRIAGQTLAAEFEEAGLQPDEAAVFSYEPGLVETDMQREARSTSPDHFPGHQTFNDFRAQGLLHRPEDVVGEMAAFLGADPDSWFTERRYGED